MESSKFVKSPVLPQGHKWQFAKKKGIYESEVTDLVRAMLQDESIKEDQRIAWERWRNDPTSLK